jgi:hypothetical protein
MPLRLNSVRFHTFTPEHSDLTSLPLEMESDSSAEGDPSEISNDGCIPKPPGEARRPRWGGYTLRIVLDWTVKDYKKLKVSLKLVSSLASVLTCYVAEKCIPRDPGSSR